MPLVFLLQDTFGKWRQAVDKLSAWNQIIRLEEILLSRARGAFLRRWFGTSLPNHGGQVQVAFANLDALIKRYRLLQSGSPERSGLNLTEPLMGLAGQLNGMLAAPIPAMVLLASLSELFPEWWLTFAAVVNWLTFGILMPILGLVFGPPILLIYLPLEKLGLGLSGVPVAYDFLGAMAEFLAAASGLLFQLVGPGEGVKNPLVRGMLDLLGQVANLLPFILTLVAVSAVYLGPLLSPLARQLASLVPLLREVVKVMQMIWTDFTDKLTELYAGKQSPWGVLQRVIRVMLNLFRHLKKGFGNLFKGAPPAPEKMSPAGVCKKPTKGPQTSAGILEALGKGWETIRPVVLGATIEHWLVKRFKEMARRFKIIGEVFGTLPPSTSKKPPGFFKKKITPLLPPLPLELQKLPAFPTVPPFPSLEDIYKRTLASGAGKPPDVAVDLGKAFVLDKDAERALERLRHPPEVFAGERLALKAKQAEARKKPQDVLAESQLKTLVFGIIDRFLPEAIAAEVPRLQVLLWQLEEAKQAAGEKAAFPVRQLLEGDRLALEVLRLRIHAPGMNKGEVQRWAEDVSLALTSQPYRTLARVEAR